jgi:capsular polysaccharide biosynthesis protein
LLPLYPSAIGFALRGSGVRLPAAIVYDGIYSVNYFHHIIDCLPRLVQLDEHEHMRRLPLLVNRWVFESPFFSYLYRRSAWFRERDWRVVEPGQWTHLDVGYILRPKQYDLGYWTEIRQAYGHLSAPKGRRIFLSRDSRRYSRGIVNEAEVIELLQRFGFETVYAEHLTLEEQQRTFEEAEYLVALQGMGMIQQIFMDPRSARIIEVMPSNRLQTEYYWQGWTLQVPFYDVQLGSALVDSRYIVDLERLAAGVERMVAHPPHAIRYGETLVCASR